MSDFYDDMVSAADDLLQEFGQAVTLTNPGAAGYDTTTGKPAGSPTTQDGFGAVFDYSTFIRSGLRDVPGSLILAGDRQLILSPLKADGTALTKPEPNHTVTLASGATYTITAVAPLEPGGTAVYFDCNIRGAA